MQRHRRKKKYSAVRDETMIAKIINHLAAAGSMEAMTVVGVRRVLAVDDEWESDHC
jgi:hypothetical protein